ncbi:hypothetical protein ACUXK4_002823 [Methylorubrum extorquens]
MNEEEVAATPANPASIPTVERKIVTVTPLAT